MDTNPDQDKFRQGLEQFNSRAFFEAHETWEEIWLPAPEPDKTFLQGIIQVAAAFHHYVRGNRSGARSLLEAGLSKLEKFPGDYRSLALGKLRAAARQWRDALATGQARELGEIPRIEWMVRD